MSTFKTSRKISAAKEAIFAAFSDAHRLARWWGPAGFTNTFNVYEFKNGGKWSLVMHGPNGQNYPNESVFTKIEAATKVVIQHVSPPRFVLTVELAPLDQGTTITWTQIFEDPNLGKSIDHIIVPANEQNLDRLTAEVLSAQ